MSGWSFRQRQFIVMLALAFTLLAASAAASLTISRDTIIRRTTAQLEAVADLKTVWIRQWLDQGRAVAYLVPNLHAMREDLPTLLAAPDAETLAQVQAHLHIDLETVSVILPSAQSVSLLHPSGGRVLLSTDPTQEGRERRGEDYFRQGQQALYVSPVAYSVSHEAPVLIVSAPVRDESGALLAVAVVEMDLADLNTAFGSHAGLGQTGRSYLVEGYGFYVTLPPGINSAPLRTIAKSEGVRRALDEQNGSDTYLDPRGVPVLGVYRWLPEHNLGLLVEIDEAELAEQIVRVWIIIAVSSVGLLALSVVIAQRMTNWLVTPLERVVVAVGALQTGDWGHRVPPGGPDEIGKLASAFNDMAASLQRSHENLEQLVEQRTGELSTANEQLREEIAERERLYEQTQRDAEIKATLLHEVNHRVGNNLTSIISILGFEQERVVVDQATHEAVMQDLVSRVRGLATVHRMLSATEWAPLLLSELAEQVITLALQALPRGKRVSVDVVPSLVQVTSRQANNLALVFNELTTNSVKYAWPECQNGRISVRIDHQENDGEDDVILIEFRDDGTGFPEDVLSLERHSIGWDLIQAIVCYGMQGEVALRNDQGAVTRIQL